MNKDVGLGGHQKRSEFIPFGAADDSPGFTVTGLDLTGVTTLISDHLGEIASALELYETLKEEMNKEGTMDRLVVMILMRLPILAAEIIAVGAGTPDLVKQAGDLAFGTQIRALSVITNLTLEDAGGLKNLFAALRPVLAGLQMPPGLRTFTGLTTEPAERMQ